MYETYYKPNQKFGLLKLTILIPAYNEENTIGKVIEEIPKKIRSIDKIETMVINDGSSDKTEEISKGKGALVYSFAKNKGLANAVSYGFSKAVEQNTDILVILDADNQYDSKEIPLLLEPILQGIADIVLGDRQVKKLDHMPVQKKVNTVLLCHGYAFFCPLACCIGIVQKIVKHNVKV